MRTMVHHVISEVELFYKFCELAGLRYAMVKQFRLVIKALPVKDTANLFITRIDHDGKPVRERREFKKVAEIERDLCTLIGIDVKQIGVETLEIVVSPNETTATCVITTMLNEEFSTFDWNKYELEASVAD